MIGLVVQVALAVVPAMLAIILHELAHGYAAWALGDDTAKRGGRLSLNPIRHVDPVGTLLLPGILLFTQLLTLGRVAFMFGWAKPVPVAAWRFRHPRQMMMIVAAAGPAMNFFLAWLAAVAIHGAFLVGGQTGVTLLGLLQLFIIINLGLGLFNLLPVPPLDGGRIVVGLLPEGLARSWAGLERGGIIIVLLVVFLLPAAARQLGYTFDPVRDGLTGAISWSFDLVLRLAGHDD